jgi:hypothetical protein
MSATGRPLRRSAAWWIALAAASHHAGGLLRMRSSLAFLDSAPDLPDGAGADVRWHVVLPVLWEQEHVAAAMTHLGELLAGYPGSSLTVVTTGREKREREHLAGRLDGMDAHQITPARFPRLTDDQIEFLREQAAAAPGRRLPYGHARQLLAQRPTTREVVETDLAARCGPVTVRHVHYDGEGRKAAQVNTAVAQMAQACDGDYVLVYDVDSRPDAEVLRCAAAVAEQHRGRHGAYPEVLQHAAEHASTGTSQRAWERAVCRGAARVQTLYTLRRELPHLRGYTRSLTAAGTSTARMRRRGLAQPVGHGLFIRLDVYRLLGGLPTFSLLDDVPFGYLLTLREVPVQVVPRTYTVAAPDTVGELFSQSARWFHSYLDYPACARRWADHGSTAAHARALSIAAWRASTWVLASPATAACLVIAADPRTPCPARAAAVTALIAGIAAPVGWLARRDGDTVRPAALAGQIAEATAAYLVRSAGPVRALARALRGGGALSPKTGRRPASAVDGSRS